MGITNCYASKQKSFREEEGRPDSAPKQDRLRGHRQERNKKRKDSASSPALTASLFPVFRVSLSIFFSFFSVKTAAKVEKGGIIQSLTPGFRF